MRESRVGTLVVVDDQRRLAGLLTERDVRFVNGANVRVSDRMTPIDRLVVHRGPLSLADAEQLMIERKVKKLPLVDDDGRLLGLITARDLLRQRRLPFATRDEQGRLRVGAAIGATGDYLERAAELVHAGVDVIVIDIAHGHSVVMDEGHGGVPQALRGRRDDRRQRRHGRRRDVSWSSAARTASRSASGRAADARRA